MPPVTAAEVTPLLINWQNGDQSALDRLVPLVYEELRRMARQYMSRERPDHTLQTTALVNEAFLKLVDQKRVNWQSGAHFFAVVAELMRRILVDHARSRLAAKRGAGLKVALDEAAVPASEHSVDLLALDAALDRLAELDRQQARVVELRYFGGRTIEETAAALGRSHATVERDWRMARAWLRRELGG